MHIRRKIGTSSIIQAAPLMLIFSLAVILWSWHTFAFIADDSLFYLVISKNLALDGYQTFSGIMSTNGAHPLWLYLLTVYSWVVALILGPETLGNIKFALPLSVALLAGGCVVWWKIGGILRINQFVIVFIPLIFTTSFDVLYSEAHLLFFTLSLLVLSLVTQDDESRTKWLLVGAMSALVVLSRLDAVFAIAALAVLLLTHKRDLSTLIITFSVFAAITIPYLASNHFIFGHIVPVSGYTKSSFPEMSFTGFTWNGGPGEARFQGYLILQGIVPTLLAFALWPTYTDKRIRAVIFTLSGGAFLQFMQIALFASSTPNHHWYYLLPIMAGTIAVANLLSKIRLRQSRFRYLAISAIVGAVSLVGLVSYELSHKVNFIRVNPPSVSINQDSLAIFSKDSDLPHFWSPFFDAMKFLNERDIEDSTIVVSDTPGGLAFYYPSNGVVAADFLTGNVLLFNRMRNSDNALRYLFDEAARIGKPVEYVMVIGPLGDWLTPSPNLRCVLYLDPKRYPDDYLIGHVQLGHPIEFVEYEREGSPSLYFIA